MNQVCRKSFRFNMRKAVHWRIAVLRHCLRSLWNHVLACWMVKSATYRQLQHKIVTSSQHSGAISGELPSAVPPPSTQLDSAPRESTSDLVPLKISLLGDRQIGKSSFLAKYVGKANGGEETEFSGINQMDKTLSVQGARISYRMWEVNGDNAAQAPIPEACKDSVAILYMFDLTSRCTLNSVGKWYKQAKKWNQTAIPVLVGTKFDEFIQLPIDMQWTIANEARTYAKAMNATLFFSSATYNINVNKIFKFVTAKLFNLSWTVERNLTIGEPIIDF